MAKDIKYDLSQARRDAEDKLRTIDFQVDTLEASDGTLAYFMPSDRTIMVNYVENGGKEVKETSSVSTLIHEQKHRDNYMQGIYAYALSPEQAYKVNMHNEISANMASLLYLRDEYLKTGNMAVFEQESGRFAFYTDALKNGEINPFSSKQDDFDKEMALIVNGTRDMWVRDFGNSSYVEQNANSAHCYGETDGKHVAFYDQNYERAKEIAYTIGGVNFAKYMDKDVEIPADGKREIYKGVKLARELGLPDYDGKMSLLQYQNLLQHALVAHDKSAGMKSEEQLMPDSDFTAGQWNTEMGAFAYLTDNKLTDYQIDTYNEALERVTQKDKLLIEEIINGIAVDYYKKGKPLPKGDDKAYNEAVDKLYSGYVKFDQDDLKFEGDVNLRKAFNPNDELPIKNIPEYAQAVTENLENMSNWTYAKKQMGNAWDECKQWCGDAYNTVKGWFDDEKNDEVHNLPIRPVDENKQPQYREWSPEERVSEVQKKQILNMTADVIKQPRRGEPDEILARKGLKNDMQKDARDKARMLKVIEGMNRINGNKNALEPNVMVNAIYDKFGDKAYELLNKAVSEPVNFAQDIGDNSIKTSRQAVLTLCNADDKQAQAVINAVLKQNGR